MKAEVAKQLPKGVDPDRFIRTTITTVQMNPELLEADRTSLFASCMQAAKDGLLPDGREATIQIYNTKVSGPSGDQWVKKAQYMPMVRGLIKKMYEAGCSKVDGVAVYEKDDFVYELGDEPKIAHRPYLGSDDPGPVVASYAIVKLENGEVKREVMPRRDIEKVRDASKASTGPGWTNWYDQFAIKAVLKRIYKQVPGRSDEFENVIHSDNEALGITFDHESTDIPYEQTPQAPRSLAATNRLKDKIKDKVQKEDLAPENDAQEAEGAIVEGESMSIKDTDGHNAEAEETTAPPAQADQAPIEQDKPTLEEIPGLKKASKLTKEQEEYVRSMDKPK
jgi:recombination protein RecT